MEAALVDYCCYPVNCRFGLVRSDPVPVLIVFPFLFLFPKLLQQLSEEAMQLFLIAPFACNIMIKEMRNYVTP
jgi:hypothetical protein